uniref:Uncharacterized protein n=1 Tax=Peronospora matthiolae TaxID=2874970 RepID=A0AAV1TQD5_9STRA
MTDERGGEVGDTVVRPSPLQAEAEVEAAAATRGSDDGAARKKSKKPWTRRAHNTRGTSKRVQATAQQEEPKSVGEIVDAACESDPTSYSVAMNCAKWREWERTFDGEVAALQNNDVWRVTRRASGINVQHTKWV